MALDADQQAIIEAVIETHQQSDQRRGLGDNVLCVQAVAGAGKSLLITEITRRLSNANYLFLCHTDNIADRARATLPANVEIATFEQAALAVVRQTHPEKTDTKVKLLVALTNRDIYNATDGAIRHNECEAVRQTLNAFYMSADRHIETRHVPKALHETEEPFKITRIVREARSVWSSQNQRAVDTAPLTNRAAIKLWTMGHTTLKTTAGHECDICIVEEAQDLPDTIIKFLSRQRPVVMMFSDDMQALNLIAPFRKPTHPLQQRGQHYRINHSYRFGGELPLALSTLRELEAAPGEPERPLITGKGETHVYESTLAMRADWLSNGLSFTFIAANAPALFDLTLTHPAATFAWVDGLYSPEHQFDVLLSMACLASIGNGRSYPRQPRSYITTGWMQRFDNLQSLYDYALQRNDKRHVSLCQWMWSRQHHDLLSHFLQLRDKEHAYQTALLEQRTVVAPDITLSMVRAAKGHEWPLVVVADSLFQPHYILPSVGSNSYVQCALRRLYTAASRAQHAIALPVPLLNGLKRHNVTLTLASHTPQPPAMLSTHPYFGVERHRQLEMDADRRAARRENLTAWKHQDRQRGASPRGSGQTATKSVLEAESHALSQTGRSPSDFLAMMRQR